MDQGANTAYDANLIRTPLAGVLAGYVMACLLAPYVVFGVMSVVGETVPRLYPDGSSSGSWPVLSPLRMVPLVAILCFAPFVILRWALSTAKPFRAWKHALAGTVLGAVMAVLFWASGGMLLAKALVLAGGLCALVSFGIEQQARKMRLRWLLSKAAAYPAWSSQLTEALDKARRQVS